MNLRIYLFMLSASCASEMVLFGAASKKATTQTEDTAKSSYKKISGNDDLQNTLDKNNAVVVKCSATWCGHCKKMKPEFEKAAEQQKNKVVFAEVDEGDKNNSEILEMYEVKGYPTTLFFKDGMLMKTEEGALTEAQLNTQAEALLTPKAAKKDAKKTTAKEIEEIVGEEALAEKIKQHDIVFLKFSTSWCSYCKTIKAPYAAFAKEYTDVGVFDVDGDKKENAGMHSSYDVDGYPTIVVLKNGKQLKNEDLFVSFNCSTKQDLVDLLEAARAYEAPAQKKETKKAAKKSKESKKNTKK